MLFYIYKHPNFLPHNIQLQLKYVSILNCGLCYIIYKDCKNIKLTDILFGNMFGLFICSLDFIRIKYLSLKNQLQMTLDNEIELQLEIDHLTNEIKSLKNKNNRHRWIYKRCTAL